MYYCFICNQSSSSEKDDNGDDNDNFHYCENCEECRFCLCDFCCDKSNEKLLPYNPHISYCFICLKKRNDEYIEQKKKEIFKLLNEKKINIKLIKDLLNKI